MNNDKEKPFFTKEERDEILDMMYHARSRSDSMMPPSPEMIKAHIRRNNEDKV